MFPSIIYTLLWRFSTLNVYNEDAFGSENDLIAHGFKRSDSLFSIDEEIKHLRSNLIKADAFQIHEIGIGHDTA